MTDELLDELCDWLRIPSVSTGEVDVAAMDRAATWVVERVRAADGEAELVRVGAGNPLVVGELRSRDPRVPTVLIYGHYDVQDPGPADAWASPPFEPEVRDGRIYARGASDDKGNFLPLLHVACALASAGRLPVHVRVLVEGEEERSGDSVATWVREDERGADVAIVFDSNMPASGMPAIVVGLRGIVLIHLSVRTGERDLHSGAYGGSTLNALHVLHALLANVLPDAGGRVRDTLRAGALEPSAVELASWRELVPGERVLADAGALPVSDDAPTTYYRRVGAAPALDVNAITGGSPGTVVPAQAEATLSLRLAPGQDPERMQRTLEDLLRSALPTGAELTMRAHRGTPVIMDPSDPALQLAAAAFERACGRRPAFVRTGGTIPIVAEMAARGYPVIVSGFALLEDGAHAPNESFTLHSLEWGRAAAGELYAALASLPGSARL